MLYLGLEAAIELNGWSWPNTIWKHMYVVQLWATLLIQNHMQVHINQHMNSFAFRICSCYSPCLEYTPILNFAAFDEHLSGPGLNFTFSAQLSVLVRLSTRSPRYLLPWCSLFIVIRLLNCLFFLPGSKFSKG